jgi:hypothetical protein
LFNLAFISICFSIISKTNCSIWLSSLFVFQKPTFFFLQCCSFLFLSDQRLLRVDPRLDCNTEEHDAYVGLAIAFMLLVGLGLPLFLVLKILRLRRSPDGLRGHVHSWGALWEGYKPEYPWFDAVIMAKKALLILIVGFVVEPYVQAALPLAIYTAYCFFSIWKAPLRKLGAVHKFGATSVDFANGLDLLSNAALALAHLYALFLAGYPTNGQEIGSVLVATHVVVLVRLFSCSVDDS